MGHLNFLSDSIQRDLGQVDYQFTWDYMKKFTDQRHADTPDEFWSVIHPPVYTLGQTGRYEHLLHPDPAIPVVHSDRGGQVTYHGPGQRVIYLLVDLRRLGVHVRQLVTSCEQALILTLAALQIPAYTRDKAPGVYTGDKKIASLGFRIRQGCSYHGLALNVAMDLRPFEQINPCGFPGLCMTDVRHELRTDRTSEHLQNVCSWDNAQLMQFCTQLLLQHLQTLLGYSKNG